MISCTGWQAGFPCTGCGSTCGVQIGTSGSFEDGSGSGSYPNDANCKWMIGTRGVTGIDITFTQFSTEPFWDFVRVYQCSNMSCDNPEMVLELSGSYSSPQAVSSTKGYMLIWFMSDSNNVFAGFTATWAWKKPDVLVCTPLQ